MTLDKAQEVVESIIRRNKRPIPGSPPEMGEEVQALEVLLSAVSRSLVAGAYLRLAERFSDKNVAEIRSFIRYALKNLGRGSE